jgi:hypothetical protein
MCQRIALLICALCIFLAACAASTRVVAPTPTPISLRGPIVIGPTVTPNFTPAPTSTRTPTPLPPCNTNCPPPPPTDTPLPTATSISTITPVPTNTPIPSSTEYDDQYAGSAISISFSSGWLQNNSATGGYFDSTFSQTQEAGTSITITFRGNQISFIGELYPTLGLLEFNLDGSQAQGTEYSQGDFKQVPIYSSPTLANTTHSLTITCPGILDPNSPGGNAYCEFDAVVISTQ